MLAADERLSQLSRDPSPAYCFWLVTRIAWASRTPDFVHVLADLGVTVPDDASVLTFVAQLSDQARSQLAGTTESGHFAELATLAMRRTLTDTVGQYTPNFLDSSVDDLQRAFRTHSTKDQFGALSRRFFADFLARTLRAFVERALSQYVGPDHRLSDIEQSTAFVRALDSYACELAGIVETFAGDWYSKHNWESKGQISASEAQGFVVYALRKLRAELKLGAPTVVEHLLGAPG